METINKFSKAVDINDVEYLSRILDKEACLELRSNMWDFSISHIEDVSTRIDFERLAETAMIVLENAPHQKWMFPVLSLDIEDKDDKVLVKILFFTAMSDLCVRNLASLTAPRSFNILLTENAPIPYVEVENGTVTLVALINKRT